MITCPRCGHENLSGNLTAKELEINKIICRGCYTVLDHHGKVIERLKHIYWIDRWCKEKHENYLEIKQGGFVVYDYKLRKYDNDERWICCL